MRRTSRSSQKGMSLIELMISSVIGLLILAGVVNVFIASRYSMRFSDGLRLMQDNGRQAVYVMQNAIRHAGLTEGMSMTDSVKPVDLANSSSVKLTLRRQSDSDCNGASTLAAADPGIAEDTYSYDEANRTIVCTGNVGLNAMVIADNVDALRFLYGLDENADGVIERYVAYDEVVNEFDVAGLYFGLLVSTDGAVKDDALSKTYTVLDSQLIKNDKLGRQVFQSSIIIRNRRTS